MYAIVVLIAFAAVLLTKSVAGFQPVVQERVVYADSIRSPPAVACQFPEGPGSSAEQTAWQIFVAATCPAVASHAGVVTWEGWAEQHPIRAVSGGGVQHEVGGDIGHPALAKAGSSTPPGGPSWVCTARRSGRTICEDILVNPAMEEWFSVARGSPPRAALAASEWGEMLLPLVEIRADWIKLASCADPPPRAHVERFGTTCYELGGIHMVSQLDNRWISATFEVQDLTSNPMRCRVLGCRDPWGSSPSVSQGGAGGNTDVSAELSSLMQEANLGSEWLNYRLDEAQMSAMDSMGNLIAIENAPAAGMHSRTGQTAEPGGSDGMWSAPVMPTVLEDDTVARRASLFSIGGRCPGEELGRDCPVRIVPAKPAMKRKT